MNGKAFSVESFDHWPTFIVIGPGKAGTSWLYQVLRSHPQVCTASAKETVFFDKEFWRGLKWYSRFFKSCGCKGSPRAIGELSNTYIFSAKAAQRIHDVFPNVKILSTLRNPIDRAFSHYLFERRNGRVRGTFEEAIDQRPDFLTRGNYDFHLKPYFDLFPREQISISLFDDLKRDNVAFAADTLAFIGVSELVDLSVIQKRVLGASVARSPMAARAGVAAASVIRRLGYPDLVTRVKTGVAERLLFKPIERSEYPKMRVETRAKLLDFYADDVIRLSERLNRDLTSLWLS